MAQVVEHETLNSNPNNGKKKKKKPSPDANTGALASFRPVSYTSLYLYITHGVRHPLCTLSSFTEVLTPHPKGSDIWKPSLPVTFQPPFTVPITSSTAVPGKVALFLGGT
jgi:hypothetical protein